MLRYKRLETLQKKHNESPTLFVRGHYLFCFCLLNFQFCTYRSEMNLVYIKSSVSLYCFVFIYNLTKHLKSEHFTSLIATNKKRRCLTSAYPTLRGLPQPCRKNKQRNTHAEVYRYTVKCARGNEASQHTTESNIQTPWRSPLHLSWFCFSIVVVSKSPKTKRQ